MSQKVIGVLGGLGPWATLDFFEKILRLTPAKADQDHLRIIIDNNPKIPDRSPAILGEGEDPTPGLIATAQNLQQAGADFLVIPCNTAHFFYDRIVTAVSIPVHGMTRKSRSEEHTPELQSQSNLACRLLLEKKQTCEPPSSSK